MPDVPDSPKSVALVIGGASGIGAVCAALLADQGWRVAIADVMLQPAQEVAAPIGGSAHFVDLADAASIAAMVASVEDSVGPIDGMAVCAAVIQPTPYRPDAFPQAEWDRVMDVDQRGSWLACQAVGKRMVARRRGAIVTVGSMAAHRSMPLHAYGPAKAGVVLLMRNLAAEWGPAGVRVNAVSPGLTLTPALRTALAQGVRRADDIISSTALGRLVEPREVAATIAFLLSQRASAITGTVIPVDAGFLAAAPWAMFGGPRPSRVIANNT